MKKHNIKFFDEEVYEDQLENGLKIFIVPNNRVEDIFVTYTVKYGGCNFPFLIDKKMQKLPSGIAHFLEHKMFEQKNRIEPFTFYSKTGTYCNASTNYYNTSYVFAGNNNFEENLKYLLDFIQDPYFTDENVEKEKGIISQEIKMYDDIPDRLIYERCIYNLLTNHPIRYGIGGKIKDITKITKEDLEKAYKVFYQPSNSFITITGNADPEKSINIIKENQKNKRIPKYKIKLKKVKEENEVLKKEEIIYKDITIPYINYGIKIPLKTLNKIDKQKLNMYISTIFNILFDTTSSFYEEMKDKNIIDTPIEIESIDTDDHKIYMLLFKSNHYELVIKEIEKVLKNIKITEEDLERKKKVYISSLLYTLDHISMTNKLIVNNIILYGYLNTDVYNLINSLNIEELNSVIKNLQLDYSSTCIIKNENN